MSDGTTLLFGLPGVRVERVERLADGTRVVQVATADETAAACPSCGVVSTSVKARVTTAPRDIPYGQDRIVVRWHKTRWRCREDYCDRGSFTEAITQIPARARTTTRLRTQIGAAIGAAVIDWLRERTPAFCAAITYVAIDPAAVYATAIRTPGLLPNATLVVDHFHLVKLANDALTKVRRRVTWDLRDRRGRRIDPEWANRRRLLRARERLSDKSFAKMWNAIVSEDDTGQILSAWIAKEELRTLLPTVRVGGDPHLTRHRLHRFLTWCADSQIPELLTLAATVDTWWPEINSFIGTGITNARTEGYNRLVKRSNAPHAGSETQTTRPDGYDFTAPAISGPTRIPSSPGPPCTPGLPRSPGYAPTTAPARSRSPGTTSR